VTGEFSNRLTLDAYHARSHAEKVQPLQLASWLDYLYKNILDKQK